LKLVLLWAGKTRDRNIGAAIKGYLERIGRYLTVEVVEVKEESASDRHAEAAALRKEGRRLLERLPQDGEIVLLDPAGRELTSEQFAGFLEKRFNSSSSRMRALTFIVGGHLGVDEEMKKVADHTLSLSRMTLTHEMARLVAVEQIYRGLSIIRNERYHRR